MKSKGVGVGFFLECRLNGELSSGRKEFGSCGSRFASRFIRLIEAIGFYVTAYPSSFFCHMGGKKEVFL